MKNKMHITILVLLVIIVCKTNAFSDELMDVHEIIENFDIRETTIRETTIRETTIRETTIRETTSIIDYGQNLDEIRINGIHINENYDSFYEKIPDLNYLSFVGEVPIPYPGTFDLNLVKRGIEKFGEYLMSDEFTRHGQYIIDDW